MTKTTQEVNPAASEYRDALEALRLQEARVDALLERQSELEHRSVSAKAAIEDARAALDRALDAGMLSETDASESAIDEARSALSVTKADAADLQEQLASVGRVLEQAREKIKPLVEHATARHRAYWRVVQQAELEALTPALDIMARAARAGAAGESMRGVGLEHHIKHLFADLGIQVQRRAEGTHSPGDLPESRPSSVHALGR